MTVPARPWRLNPHESVNTGSIYCPPLRGGWAAVLHDNPSVPHLFKPVCLSDWYRATISNEMLLLTPCGQSREVGTDVASKGVEDDRRCQEGPKAPLCCQDTGKDLPGCTCCFPPSMGTHLPGHPVPFPHIPCAQRPLCVYM